MKNSRLNPHPLSQSLSLHRHLSRAIARVPPWLATVLHRMITMLIKDVKVLTRWQRLQTVVSSRPTKIIC